MNESYTLLMIGTFLGSIAAITFVYWIRAMHERKHK